MRAIVISSGLLVAALAGCTPDDPWDNLHHGVESIVPGAYTGAIRIVVGAYLGTVQLAQATCNDEIPMVVDLEARFQIEGVLTCVFPYIGEQTVEIEGVIEELPFIDGDTDGDLDLDWEGGFTSPTTFFGEAYGEDDHDGMILRLEGSIDAWRTGP